jgi:hypothetical protein
VTATEDTSAQRLGLTGTLRLTSVTDHLAHIPDDIQADEAMGTWTGLSCPDHVLQIGSDTDNATLPHLAGPGEIADPAREPPADFQHRHPGPDSTSARISDRKHPTAGAARAVGMNADGCSCCAWPPASTCRSA